MWNEDRIVMIRKTIIMDAWLMALAVGDTIRCRTRSPTSEEVGHPADRYTTRSEIVRNGKTSVMDTHARRAE